MHLLIRILTFLIVLHAPFVHAFQVTNQQEVNLTGTAEISDALSYRLLPFEVPKGTGAIQVSYNYSGREQGNEIEIGLYDPDGFRGNSRFSKDEFVVGKYQSTASYFPGAMPPGSWNISLAFPSIVQRADYKVAIRIIPETHREFTGPSIQSLSSEERWYAGDFHTHTGHSDGFGCKDTLNKRTPCQVYQVAEAAHRNGLDFVAIADHNTASHYQDMEVLQPNYPNLLLVRGQEITTYFGHANVFGSGIPVGFRLGFNNLSISDIQKKVAETGALLSINHPGRETGASCTGCGWNAPSTDYSQLEVVEVINGTNIENDISGIPFWENLLSEGHRVIGIGGSDDHTAGSGGDKPGNPTTMVFADELSEKGLIEAVRKGKVYIRTMGEQSPLIEFKATSGSKTWEMGSTISLSDLSSDNKINVLLEIRNGGQTSIELIHNGDSMEVPHSELSQNNGNLHWEHELKLEETEWFRINLRDKEGVITVLSNPIFVRN